MAPFSFLKRFSERTRQGGRSKPERTEAFSTGGNLIIDRILSACECQENRPLAAHRSC
jgi:hypothetical protein